RVAESLKELDEALALDRSCAWARFYRAAALCALGRVEDAEAEATRVSGGGGSRVPAPSARGTLRRGAGRHRRAGGAAARRVLARAAARRGRARERGARSRPGEGRGGGERGRAPAPKGGRASPSRTTRGGRGGPARRRPRVRGRPHRAVRAGPSARGSRRLGRGGGGLPALLRAEAEPAPAVLPAGRPPAVARQDGGARARARAGPERLRRAEGRQRQRPDRPLPARGVPARRRGGRARRRGRARPDAPAEGLGGARRAVPSGYDGVPLSPAMRRYSIEALRAAS